jgi:hypothetical protein
MKENIIRVVGANEHNLQNLSVDIPRDKFHFRGRPAPLRRIAFRLCTPIPRPVG